MKKTGLLLLQLIQALYQQKIITREDKTKLACFVQNGMKTGNYNQTKEYLKAIKCQKEDNMELINQAMKMVEENKYEYIK